MSSSRPATYVPEDLISQAQGVLQGRSRSLIIRELQRTNLDVNLAVNNLLSRDEEDGDDGDEAGEDNYRPEDLISLLDAGINADHPSVIIDADAMFSEDMFGYSQRRSSSSSRRSSERERPSTSASASGADAAAMAAAATSAAIVVSQASERQSTTTAGGSASSESSSNREAIFRWRDRQYYSGPKRWLESALRDPAWQDKDDSNDAKKSSNANNSSSDANQSPLWLGDDLEFWPDRGAKDKVKFVSIAALNNELVAVSDRGHLYQWRWSDITPLRHDNPSGNHPRSSGLGLTSERVVKISASNVR